MFFASHSDFDERISIKAAEFCEQVISEMGAEIHDDLIQKLSSMSFTIERIERASQDPEILHLVNSMRSDFENVTQSVRAISRRLHPVHKTDVSFYNSINQLCDSMQRPGNGHISCTSAGTEYPLSHVTYTYLYRIIQELIHNAFRHSAAWKIDVRIEWLRGSITIEVEDDGTGSLKSEGVTSVLNQKRSTLAMRSQAIKATLTYSKGRKGLVARVRCPLPERHLRSEDKEP